MSTVIEIIDAFLAQHVRSQRIRCNAKSAPIQHYHSNGSRDSARPQVMTCSERVGHDGDHRDAFCCYWFERFSVAKVHPTAPHEPVVLWTACTCGATAHGDRDPKCEQTVQGFIRLRAAAVAHVPTGGPEGPDDPAHRHCAADGNEWPCSAFMLLKDVFGA